MTSNHCKSCLLTCCKVESNRRDMACGVDIERILSGLACLLSLSPTIKSDVELQGSVDLRRARLQPTMSGNRPFNFSRNI